MVILSAMRAVIDNLRVVLHVEEHLHLEVVSSAYILKGAFGLPTL